MTDSVDADDGSIDGSGTNGHSFFSGSGSTGITFTFDATVLGSLPTQVGILWTDGSGTTLFEAFGPGGVPLGQIGPVAIADGSFVGETAEDRFFGVTNPGGISAIRISNTSGGIEVDHLQYGIFALAPSADLAITKTAPASTQPARRGFLSDERESSVAVKSPDRLYHRPASTSFAPAGRNFQASVCSSTRGV